MSGKIKPGSMGSAEDPKTTPPEFAGSMAAAIEDVFNVLLGHDGLPRFPTDDNSKNTRDRRRFFVAIARGVTQHLDQNSSAISLSVPDGLGGTEVVHPAFDIEGKTW